ncbi:hypothetical protein ZTR_10744 [Talaromyces verruculosus]|nr:hypothetical protein ZTR_10744 [Talaromyces verruculosus]
MPKRKHSELDGEDGDGKFNRVKATRLGHKFERGTQLLFRALKTSRGFERQKLGRRQKTAKSEKDEKTLERLEKEVHVLKALDLEETAQRYLLKQLNKTKRIAESPEFVRLEKSINGSINSGPRDPAEANVTARLFKSNPVQNALPEILTDIRTLLGIDDTSKKKPQQKAVSRKEADKEDSPEESSNEREIKQDDVPSKSAKDAKSKEEYLNDINMDDVSDNESMDLSYFDARLASASDGSDSEDEGENLPIKHTLTSNKATYKIPDDISISSSAEPSISEYSEAESESESPPPPTLPKSKPSTKDITTDKPKDTTFLPSLMMGGYWSGSESEPEEDDEVAAAATGSKPQRKNRMGQQARRALWEKKYGARAKHIQEEKQKKGRNNKNSGWDARRGATDDNDKPRWATGANKRPYTGSSSRNGGGGGGEKDTRNENAIAANKKKAYDGLHPSWEAARKAKQEKAQASFQGKKITFD